MKLKLYIFSVMLLFIATMSAQDVSFNAKIDNNEIGINEQLSVSFEINQDGENFKAPSFENFTISKGPSRAITRSFHNGKGSYSKTFSYVLVPKQIGEFTIGQAEMTFEGKVYITSPLKITITDAVDISKKINAALENIHLVAEVSESNPYLNQAFTVVYKLYVSNETSVNNWEETSLPKFTDFWNQDIDEEKIKIHEGEYEGKPYRYVILKRTVLYPQKTGKLTIEPLAVKVSGSIPTKKRDIFGRSLTENITISVATENKTIDVKPLPSKGKPDNFTGAVGTFDFTVETNKNPLHTSELFQISVAINGNGNLSLLDLPKPKLSNKLKIHESKNKDAVSLDLNGMSGFKKTVYTIEVIRRNEKYIIPSISFSYFNPKAERYERKTSDEFVIEMTSNKEQIIRGKINGKNKNH